MTPVGHSLFGATIAVAAAPRTMSRTARLAMMGAFVVLANVPDISVRGWGHHRYDISHSLFVNLGLIVTASMVAIFLHRARYIAVGPRIIIAGGLAWLSHLLLDSFYNHGLGIAIYWPFSSARLALPIPWFSVLHRSLPHADYHAVRVMSIELAAYGSLFLVVLLIRRAVSKRLACAGGRSRE
jgi:hypothetical protein